MNPNPSGAPRGVLLLVTALGVILTQAAHAGLIVHVHSSPLPGGLFEYEFSVSNQTPDPLAIVSLLDAPTGDAVLAASLTGPMGFLTNYDSGLGIVDFLEGTSTFGSGSTIHGFSFQSGAAPGTAFQFIEALNVRGDHIPATVTVPDGGDPSWAAVAGLVLFACWRKSR